MMIKKNIEILPQEKIEKEKTARNRYEIIRINKHVRHRGIWVRRRNKKRVKEKARQRGEKNKEKERNVDAAVTSI